MNRILELIPQHSLLTTLFRNVRLGADSVSKADGQCSNHCVPADASPPRIIATNAEHLPIESSFPSSSRTGHG